MKTVVVILEFQSKPHFDWAYVTESSVFGEGTNYLTAHDFIQTVQELHKKHSHKYKINNVIIG